MSDASPTRSAVIEMKDERRAMHEGYVFLDEKCLLLAGEILRELERHGRLQREFIALHSVATAALQAAVARHGLQGLQVYPPTDLAQAQVRIATRSLMGVRLQEAEWAVGHQAFASVLASAAALAAVSSNLERLSLEYRRSVRRARALQDVMLPELDHTLYDIENRLEELEQEDAVCMRQGAGL
jgi:V/A-type H+-transporting ATPase subunit D